MTSAMLNHPTKKKLITVFQIKTSFAVLYSFTWQFKAKKGATIIYNVCFEQLNEKSYITVVF